NLIYYFSSHRIRISFLRKNNYLNGFGDTTPWEILRPSPFISGKFVKRSKRIHPIHNLLKRSGVSAIGLRTKLSSRGSVVRIPQANFFKKTELHSPYHYLFLITWQKTDELPPFGSFFHRSLYKQTKLWLLLR